MAPGGAGWPLLTWDDVIAILDDGSYEAMSRLGRSAEALAVYHKHIAQLKEKYRSVQDNLEIDLFGAVSEVAADGKLTSCGVPTTNDGEPTVVWRQNDFPYNFSPGIAHHLLWATAPLPADRVQQQIDAQLAGQEAVWFVNHPSLQSVRAIWHCHVISRPKASADHAKAG